MNDFYVARRRVEPDRAEESGEIDLNASAHRAVDDVLERRHLHDRVGALDDHRVVRQTAASQRRPNLSDRIHVLDADANTVARLVVVHEHRPGDLEGTVGRRVLPALELLPSVPGLEHVHRRVRQAARREIRTERALRRSPARTTRRGTRSALPRDRGRSHRNRAPADRVRRPWVARCPATTARLPRVVRGRSRPSESGLPGRRPGRQLRWRRGQGVTELRAAYSILRTRERNPLGCFARQREPNRAARYHTARTDRSPLAGHSAIVYHTVGGDLTMAMPARRVQSHSRPTSLPRVHEVHEAAFARSRDVHRDRGTAERAAATRRSHPRERSRADRRYERSDRTGRGYCWRTHRRCRVDG